MVKYLSIAVALVFVAFLAWFMIQNAESDGTQNNPSLNYENASSDMIVVEAPQPGTVLPKEFTISGTARGNWFFEASFPIQVTDQQGNTIYEGFATASGEWMTTDFVPYSGTVSLAGAYSGLATLILKKDNPSGLPENDASVSFPIVIE